MNIIFFGTNDFAVESLQKLAENFNIALVVTKSSKPIGRDKTILPTPVEVRAKKLKLNIISPEKLDDNAVDKIKSLNPDMFVVVDYGKIIGKEILDIPKKGAINIHPSNLPKYRGASPIQTAILNGEVGTAITIMLMDNEMDHGPILAQEKIDINSGDTYGLLYKKLGEPAAKLLITTIEKYLSEKIKPVEQNHNKATFTKILKREDGKIDWAGSAKKIEQMVRAYDPWPGTFTISNNKRIKILKVSISPQNYPDKTLGDFFKTPHDELAVTCGQNTTLLIHMLQPEGKKSMTGKQFIQGYLKNHN